MKSQSVKKECCTQREEQAKFRKVEKYVLWGLIIYFLSMCVLYSLSLSFILKNREDDDQSKCPNKYHRAKIISYLVIVGVAIVVWTNFTFVIRRERNLVWLERRAYFVYLLVGLLCSFALKIYLQRNFNIFDSYNDDTSLDNLAPIARCNDMT